MRTPKELFNEIVKLASSVGQPSEEAKEVAISEEVVLSELPQEEDSVSEVELADHADEEVTEEPTEEVLADEAPAPAEAPTNDYVTRSEYESALNEMKEMYAKVLEVVSPSSPEEVPADLSTQEVEVAVEMSTEVEVDLSADEAQDDLVHTPESEVKETTMHLYGQSRRMTTEDFVFNSIFNK